MTTPNLEDTDHLGDTNRLVMRICFVSMWTILYAIMTYRGGKDAFAKSYFPSSLHTVGIIILSSISLWYKDDMIFSEAIPTAFSGSFFLIDLLDCAYRNSKVFTIHAILSLVLSVMGWVDPMVRHLRLGSKGYLCEGSTLQLHRCKRTKSKMDFLLFFGLFTVFRPVWLGFVVKEVMDHSDRLHVSVVWVTWIMYTLQICWWIKLILIIWNNKDPSKEA